MVVVEPILKVEGLHKRFGGVVASDAVSLAVGDNECHALIGPNGAGKTTLVAEISGEIAPDAGYVFVRGQDVTQLAAPVRTRLGLARSYQVTSLFPGFTALDNVALAVQARSGHSFRFWRQAQDDPELRLPAQAALERVGLGDKANRIVERLAHGEQRALEIAVALATQPKLLLLDEPMAGMGPSESERMVNLLAGLKGQVSMLLVEHDMDAVFRLADRISVLVYGKVIASGAPEAIRADDEVRRAYLGDETG
jgi:branched-chain amino acid transport system ATP-binding protein